MARIVTWNVNGIRNPFSYEPWRSQRTYEAMFDTLEADIVVMQELKVQKKDLTDSMVLVNGWDCFMSLPAEKKGYSGVAIYARTSVCSPIHAEEGVTGILRPPNSSTSYRDLPADQQIGGYPSIGQLSSSPIDAAVLDSEGRCVVLEFPAFVLFGCYCPANRDDTRDDFRLGFLSALDARVRNLVAMGKRVVLTGDLNIVRDVIDTADVDAAASPEEFVSTPARRILNQLLEDGRVFGERDEGRDQGIMQDLSRISHPERKGMYTCWNTKINARPGNFGSRIDYVLCSTNMDSWFSSSDIQAGLYGSDHCPVYAVLCPKVKLDDRMVDIKEIMNPPHTFQDGNRVKEWSTKYLLPLSARLMPEFRNRRSIKDMFSKPPSIPKAATASPSAALPVPSQSVSLAQSAGPATSSAAKRTDDGAKPNNKRPHKTPAAPAKRAKLSSQSTTANRSKPDKGQSNLKGWFVPKQPENNQLTAPKPTTETESPANSQSTVAAAGDGLSNSAASGEVPADTEGGQEDMDEYGEEPDATDGAKVVDSATAQATFAKLMSGKVVPRCEHNEHCKMYICKKKGINQGRSFYLCPRPLGPTGKKEVGGGGQWRCSTFKWASEI